MFFVLQLLNEGEIKHEEVDCGVETIVEEEGQTSEENTAVSIGDCLMCMNDTPFILISKCAVLTK